MKFGVKSEIKSHCKSEDKSQNNLGTKFINEEIGMTLKISYSGGNCPVQVEGTIDNVPFYFRARGEHWSMGIGSDPICTPDFYKYEKYGAGSFEAGWMEESVALEFVAQCIDEYLKKKESQLKKL